jgi:hypothetical protein
MRPARRTITVALITILTGACSAGTAVSPRVAPSAVLPAPTPLRTVGATPTTGPTGGSTSTLEPSIAAPPAAAIVVDGSEYAGTVGAFAWVGGSDAAPWLPASVVTRVEVPARARLQVVASGAPPIEAWVARAAPAADADGAVSPTGLAEGSGDPSFPVPGVRDSVVAVELHFTGGGDGVWYWHLVVR